MELKSGSGSSGGSLKKKLYKILIKFGRKCIKTFRRNKNLRRKNVKPSWKIYITKTLMKKNKPAFSNPLQSSCNYAFITQILLTFTTHCFYPFTAHLLLTFYNAATSNPLQPICLYPFATQPVLTLTTHLLLAVYNPAESNLLQTSCF